MFICYECGRVFDEPKGYSESRGEHFGFPAYEDYSGCPSCGGAYTETYRCDSCGEWISGTYVEIGDEKFCDGCFTIKDIGE